VVVIAKRVGRLANRILLFAHFIATAAEHGFHVVNPAFGKYAHYFPSTSGDLLCRYPAAGVIPPVNRYVRELFYHACSGWAGVLHVLQQGGRDVGLIRLLRHQSLDLDNPQFLSFLRRRRAVFVQDWFFRSDTNCETHGEAVRSFFTPWGGHLRRVDDVVESARRRDRFLVGVHIRQDDYSKFKGGRFFYSHEQYRQVMIRVEEAFADRNVSFLLSSDAPVPEGCFDGFDTIRGNGHELEDLYALAACDRLIGPPSTYSKWASYYGQVPRYEIFDPAQPVAPDSFEVARRLAPGLTWLEPIVPT
jgi:hypothetical protein